MESQFQRIFQDQALCVTHGQLAVTKWKSADNRASMVAALRFQLQHLAAEMRVFIDKHDHHMSSNDTITDAMVDELVACRVVIHASGD